LKNTFFKHCPQYIFISGLILQRLILDSILTHSGCMIIAKLSGINGIAAAICLSCKEKNRCKEKNTTFKLEHSFEYFHFSQSLSVNCQKATNNKQMIRCLSLYSTETIEICRNQGQATTAPGWKNVLSRSG